MIPLRSGRRRVLQFGSVAAAAVAVGAVADHVAMSASRPAEVAEGPLVPNDGTWTRVAASTELPDGAVRGFEVDGVAGFVRRDGGQVAAVSGDLHPPGLQAAAWTRPPCSCAARATRPRSR